MPLFSRTPHSATRILFCCLMFGIWCSRPLHATPITLDLGAPGITAERTMPFADLNGVPVAGQTLSLDFTFAPGQFGRLFSVTHLFDALLRLDSDYGGFVGFANGTGHLLDQYGNPLTSARILGSASGSDGSMALGLFVYDGELATPVDFFGVHYDLTLPTPQGGASITGAHLGLIAQGLLGIGPRLPRDVVPDTGNTLLLLALSVAALVTARAKFGR